MSCLNCKEIKTAFVGGKPRVKFPNLYPIQSHNEERKIHKRYYDVFEGDWPACPNCGKPLPMEEHMEYAKHIACERLIHATAAAWAVIVTVIIIYLYG